MFLFTYSISAYTSQNGDTLNLLFKQVAANDLPSMMNRTRGYSIMVYDKAKNKVETFDYNITGNEFALPWILSATSQDVRSYRVQRKSKNFHSSVQAFSMGQYFFPAPGLFNFTCFIQQNLEEVYNCSIKRFDKEENHFPYRKFTFTTISPVFNPDDGDKIDGFSHGNSMHDVANTKLNKMSTNCYQEVCVRMEVISSSVQICFLLRIDIFH